MCPVPQADRFYHSVLGAVNSLALSACGRAGPIANYPTETKACDHYPRARPDAKATELFPGNLCKLYLLTPGVSFGWKSLQSLRQCVI